MKLKICLIIFLILININNVNAIELNHKYTIFTGSGIHYTDNQSEYVGVRDVSYNIDNIKNRWVEFRLVHKGDVVRIERCYNFDYCQIGNIKIQVLNIFLGKEASMVQFKIMKVYI